MNLRQIYEPIADDLKLVEGLLASSISESNDHYGPVMRSLLVESPGKRIRPALVFLSERAASAGRSSTCDRRGLIEIATAVELIHIASLIHDDVLDGATMRHSRPTINARYGDDVSIVLGDYIYSKAFQLIGNCGNTDIFACMSEAIHSMCQGELMHVCQRRNLDLSKDSYIVIAKKKTASLFAASCHAGTIIGNHSRDLQTALKEFGLNFGVAFQIVDDCRDVISEEGELGKQPGQDVITGDVTLPLLTLSDTVGRAEREEIKNMLGSANDKASLSRLRAMLANSDALCKTEQVVTSYLAGAKERLNSLADSVYKESLSRLVEHTTQRSF